MPKKLWQQAVAERGKNWPRFVTAVLLLFLSGYAFNWLEIAKPFEITSPSGLAGIAIALAIPVCTLATILFYKTSKLAGLIRGPVEGTIFFVLFAAGMCFWAYFALYQINVRFDHSTSIIHNQIIKGKNKTYAKYTHWPWHVGIEDWHKPGETYTLDVDSAVYASAKVGDVLKITIRSGYLGYEWIEASFLATSE